METAFLSIKSAASQSKQYPVCWGYDVRFIMKIFSVFQA